MNNLEKFILDNYFSDSISYEDKKLWLDCNQQAQSFIKIFKLYLDDKTKI